VDYLFLVRPQLSVNSSRTLRGACLCGCIRYEVADEFQYAMNCHCSDCRKATGSVFKPFGGIERNKLRIVDGREQILLYGGPDANHDVHCKVCDWLGTYLIALRTVRSCKNLYALALRQD